MNSEPQSEPQSEPRFLNPHPNVPESITETLNAVIEAYLAGTLRGISVTALVAHPVSDGAGVGIGPVTGIWSHTPVLGSVIQTEMGLQLFEANLDTLMSRKRMAAAQVAAEQRQKPRKAPILNANGSPMT